MCIFGGSKKPSVQPLPPMPPPPPPPPPPEPIPAPPTINPKNDNQSGPVQSATSLLRTDLRVPNGTSSGLNVQQ